VIQLSMVGRLVTGNGIATQHKLIVRSSGSNRIRYYIRKSDLCVNRF